MEAISKSLAELERSRIRVACVAGFLILCAWVLICWNTQALGLDFPGFWVAGRIDPAHLYQPEVFQPYGRELLKDLHIEYVNVYARPAVFSLPLRLWMQQPYMQAFGTWVAVQGVAACVFLVLLWRMYRPDPRLMPLLLLLWPVAKGISHGHDVATVGVALVAGLLALQAKRDVVAGILWGLCLYKFNLVVSLPLLLLWHRRWRALGAFSVTGIVLALSSAAIAPPEDYVRLLGRLHEVSWDFSPEIIMSLRGAALRFDVPLLYPILAAVAWATALWTIPKVDIASGVAVGVFTSLLTAYHLGDYDYTLVWIPMGLMIAKGGWFERTMVGVGLLWVLGFVFLRDAIVPFYALLWISMIALLVRQAPLFRERTLVMPVQQDLLGSRHAGTL